VFVPLNLALLCVLPERGIFNIHGLQRLGVFAGEMLFTLWVVYAPATRVTAWAMAPFVQSTLLAASPVRQLGWIVLTFAVMASLATWVLRRAPLDLAFTGALLAYTLALNLIGEPNAFTTYLTAAALIFTVALVRTHFAWRSATSSPACRAAAI